MEKILRGTAKTPRGVTTGVRRGNWRGNEADRQRWQHTPDREYVRVNFSEDGTAGFETAQEFRVEMAFGQFAKLWVQGHVVIDDELHGNT
jgi:hypothetical protein